jgi:hypothetical protein
MEPTIQRAFWAGALLGLLSGVPMLLLVARWLS